MASTFEHEEKRRCEGSNDGDKSQGYKHIHGQDYPVKSRTRFIVLTLATVIAVLMTGSLGRWQLSRAAQKEALQATMDAQGKRPPLQLADILRAKESSALLHQPAHLRGTWVDGTTVYLDNRQMDGKVGFFVFTVLRLQTEIIAKADGNLAPTSILVQRGWIPRNFERRSELPPVQTPTEAVEVLGYIAPPPSKLYEPGSPGLGAIRQNLDLAQFAKEKGLLLLPFTLQQTGAASEGLRRDWPAVNLGVEKHYGYAFQWFGLATLVALLYLWFQIVRPITQRPKGP